jgi:3-oxoadipate enol-lactonase
MQPTGTNIYVKTKDISVCYDGLGYGDMPMVFIHGFPFSKSSWQPQMDFFKSSHRVIAYDIRGFGKSTSGKEKPSINLLADDLINFLDALEIEKVIACGLSMGGYILLNAVNRFQKRFKAIILSDTQCIADSHEVKEKRNETIRHIESGGQNAFAEEYVKNIFCKESLSEKKEIVNKIKEIIISTSAETVVETLSALKQRWETCSVLHEISVPALILCGEEDMVIPFAQSEFLHKHIANSVLHSIGKAGHLSNLEQPEEFNGHIKDFILGLPKEY